MELICNPVYVVLVDDSAESSENEMSDASVTAEFTVGERVRVFPDTSDERPGVLVEDFGQDAGYAVDIGTTHIADASRRWAVTLDDGSLVFVDSSDIVVDVDAGDLPSD